MLTLRTSWARWTLGTVAMAATVAGCQTQVATQQEAKQYAFTGTEMRLDHGQGIAAKESDKLEIVSLFTGPMPTGVAVSQEGRIFVSFPRWDDPVAYTVAELRDGKVMAYPSEEINRFNPMDAKNTLVSVQAVEIDPNNRLWLLDTGNINMGINTTDGPKLVCVNLQNNQIEKTIHFPGDVAMPTTYLNDVRFDMRKNKAGVAYITDSSVPGPNGIIVVDLDSGQSWRKLNNDPSVRAQPDFVPMVEGRELRTRPAIGPEQAFRVGADGIALSPNGQWLYYRPLVSHHLFRVKTEALLDRNLGAEQTAKAVEDLGDTGFASDGIRCDAQGRLYLTDYENMAIRRGEPRKDARYDILVQDPRMIWPDTLALGPDGWLYVTSNQLDRRATFNAGKDMRKPPYALFRIKTDGSPIMLKGGMAKE